MDTIQVELRPASERGRLYPRYVRSAKILTIASRAPREWPYGINVDNILILDIDAERLLANVDVQWGMGQWPIRELPPAMRPEASADLHFLKETCDQKFFDLSVNLWSDKERSRTVIDIGQHPPGVRAVRLSEYCAALLCENSLVGFDVRPLDTCSPMR